MRQPADPEPASSVGVELTRLIALARLTAPQALEIAEAVLGAAGERSETDAGDAVGRVAIGPVRIGADGRVEVLPAANGNPSSAGQEVASVLADIAAAARLRGGAADQVPERRLAELDRAVTELPVAGVAAVATRLREAAASIDRTAVRAELGALVTAVGAAVGSADGRGPAATRSTAVRPAAARGDGGVESRRRRRRIGAWLVSLVVLASVVTVEVVMLRDEIATDVALLLDAGRSGATPSAVPEPDGLPVEAPAPAAAGSVAAVDLRPLGQCAPDARCRVRVLVRLVPGSERQVVSWSYRYVDRCTGATDTAAGGSVAVPAGGERAAAVGTVSLPAMQAVAVIAVTETPAVAASAPFYVGSCLPDPQAG